MSGQLGSASSTPPDLAGRVGLARPQPPRPRRVSLRDDRCRRSDPARRLTDARLRSSAGQSSGLLIRRSHVRIVPEAPKSPGRLTYRSTPALRWRGLAPATIRQIHAIMRASLHQAVRWGLVPRNVASLASAPSQPQREQHPPAADEVMALIRAAEGLEPMFGLFVRVLAATGMRRGEACGVRSHGPQERYGRSVFASLGGM